MSSNRPLKVVLLVFVAVGLMWPVIGDRVQAALRPEADGCAGANELPHAERLDEARAAVLCLLNARRSEHGLSPLRENRSLQAAAQAHAEDMGARDFYAHRNPDGASPTQRMRAAGFNGRVTAENIHWGVGINATPAQMVSDWMQSPGHRANILNSELTQVGTGIGYDAPELLHDDAAVFVNNFGG